VLPCRTCNKQAVSLTWGSKRHRGKQQAEPESSGTCSWAESNTGGSN